MLKKAISLIIIIMQASITHAATCPITLDVATKNTWHSPTDWNEAYHHRHPKKPITFANVSAYKKGDHYAIYCYYNGDYTNQDKYSTFVIVRDYPLDQVNLTKSRWYTLYKDMHQCGTPDINQKDYPTEPSACAW